MIKRDLLKKQNNPYYIVAPDYTRKSMGIRVMHYLCHALNISGENAFMVTNQVNPELRTPILTQNNIQYHLSLGLNPIAVYPEIYHGNPLGAKTVVRYLLNEPGLCGGPVTFDPNDILFAFRESLRTPDTPENNLLYMPLIDRSIFNYNPKEQNKRDKILFYLAEYRNGENEYPELMNFLKKNAIQITSNYPESHLELADLFRKAKVLVCFHFSNLAGEALLCGCPVHYISTQYTTYLQDQSALNVGGIANSMNDESIEEARKTLEKFNENFKIIERNFWTKLDYFIEVTQEKSI